MDNKELKANELEQVSGGWEYNGDVEWLKGYNIKCPYCGAEDEETVQYCGRSKMLVGFRCAHCAKQFQYLYSMGKVYVKK